MPVRGQLRVMWSHLRRRSAPDHRSLFDMPDLHSQRRFDARFRVGVLVYAGVTTAEIDEPVSALAAGLDADVIFIGATDSAGADRRAEIVPGSVAVSQTVTGIEPVRVVHLDCTTDDPLALTADVLVIPGGLGWERVADDLSIMTWLAHAANEADGVMAISTGSLILASAGHLKGRPATGHWLARASLAALGAEVRTERTVRSGDRRVVTASGAQSARGAARELAERVRWGPA